MLSCLQQLTELYDTSLQVELIPSTLQAIKIPNQSQSPILCYTSCMLHDGSAKGVCKTSWNFPLVSGSGFLHLSPTWLKFAPFSFYMSNC